LAALSLPKRLHERRMRQLFFNCSEGDPIYLSDSRHDESILDRFGKTVLAWRKMRFGLHSSALHSE
jgi:hypothetical protein